MTEASRRREADSERRCQASADEAARGPGVEQDCAARSPRYQEQAVGEDPAPRGRLGLATSLRKHLVGSTRRPSP